MNKLLLALLLVSTSAMADMDKDVADCALYQGLKTGDMQIIFKILEFAPNYNRSFVLVENRLKNINNKKDNKTLLAYDGVFACRSIGYKP